MANRVELLQEAERRGLSIPEQDRALLAEARKRGLVPGGQQAGELDGYLRATGDIYAEPTPKPPQSAPSAPQPDSQRGNAFTRALGEIGGRQVLQGAAGLYGALGGDALNHYVLDPLDRALFPAEQSLSGLVTGQQPQQRSVLGTGGRTYREAADGLADNLGMRAPQTSSERVMSDVGEALAGTGLTLGIGGGLNMLAGQGGNITSRIGSLLSGHHKTQVASAASGAGAASAAREHGASPGAQALIGLGAGLAPGVIPTTSAMTTRGAFRGASGDVVQGNIDRFAAAGTTPTAGQASETSVARGLEALLGRIPGGAGPMSRKMGRQAGEIGGAVERLAARLAPASDPARAGRAIERGVTGTGGFMDSFKGQSQKLYSELDQYLPLSTRVGASNAIGFLSKKTSPIPGAAATSAILANPKLAGIRQALETDLAAGNGAIPYEALKRIRSDVGELIQNAGLNPDISAKELRGLYGALSEDLKAAAVATGNPKAIAAFNRANWHFRAGMDRLEMIESVVGRNGGPEAVFKAAITNTQEGATKLRAVMQSLPKDAQRLLSATMLRRLGRATNSSQDDLGEVFSPETFLTNWNKLSRQAKGELFGRYDPGFSLALDKIAKVASNLREGTKVVPNPPGTAGATAQWFSAGGFVVAALLGRWDAAGAIAATVGSAKGAAHLVQHPAFVKWLAKATDIPYGALPAQITMLRQIAEKEGDQDVVELADGLQRDLRGQSPGLEIDIVGGTPVTLDQFRRTVSQ